MLRHSRTFLAAALCATVVGLSPTGLPRRAAAQPETAPTSQPDAAAIDEAKKRYANGQKLYEAGEFKAAVDEFKEAYRLTKNPLLLYNIGFVYDRMDDTSLALHYYNKFLADAAEGPKTHDRRVEVDGRVTALKKAAGVENVKPPTNTETPTQPDKKPGVTAFTHETVDEAPPGLPLDLGAQVPAGSGLTVTLFFRGGGEDLFKGVPMKPRLQDLIGRIPAAVMQGTSIHYYIEAKDAAGKTVAGSGKASVPNIVYLNPQAKPHYYLDPTGDTMVTTTNPELPPQLQPIKGPTQPGTTDTGPSKGLTYAKWATTGGALVFLGAGIAFYLSASSYATTIEGEAFASSHECPTPPCRAYSDARKDLESTGQSFSTLSRVSLVLGGASLVAAGVFWYMDFKRESAATPGKAAAPAPARVTAVPVVGDGLIGGAAVVTF